MAWVVRCMPAATVTTDLCDLLCSPCTAVPPSAAEERWRQQHPQLLGRTSFVGADFFTDPLPPADAYFLRFILHDWPDAEATAILRAVRRAMAPGSRAVLLVQDVVMPERQPGVVFTTLDLQVGLPCVLGCHGACVVGGSGRARSS